LSSVSEIPEEARTAIAAYRAGVSTWRQKALGWLWDVAGAPVQISAIKAALGHRDNIHIYLKGLCDDGLLETHGNRREPFYWPVGRQLPTGWSAETAATPTKEQIFKGAEEETPYRGGAIPQKPTKIPDEILRPARGVSFETLSRNPDIIAQVKKLHDLVLSICRDCLIQKRSDDRLIYVPPERQHADKDKNLLTIEVQRTKVRLRIMLALDGTTAPGEDYEPDKIDEYLTRLRRLYAKLVGRRDLSQDETATPSVDLPLGARPRLLVLHGLKRNVEYPINKGLNFIGRSDEKPVDIDLQDQEALYRCCCSGLHACLSLENHKLQIEDLNSATGTYVNQTRIIPGQKRYLAPNDTIKIGHVQLKVIV
jgi:hypothetical protein